MTRIIIAIITSVILISGTLGFLLGNPDAFAANEKVNICHFPPGNPENAQNIIVSINAVPAHIEEHGDFVGTCEDGPDCTNFPDQPACGELSCEDNCRLRADNYYRECIEDTGDQVNCAIRSRALLEDCLRDCEPPNDEVNLVSCFCAQTNERPQVCTATTCDDAIELQTFCEEVCGGQAKAEGCTLNARECVIQSP